MKNKIFISIAVISMLLSCGGPAKQSPDENRTTTSSQEKTSPEIREDVTVPAAAPLADTINLKLKTPSDRLFLRTAEVKFKVKNTQKATETIEEMAVACGGYLTYSHISNDFGYKKTYKISRDSVLVSQEVTVNSEIHVRIPNEKLDSFVRALNTLVVFLDYRTIRLEDITTQYKLLQQKNLRLEKGSQRQQQLINTKPSNLNQASQAESQLLNQQMNADEILAQTLQLSDKLKYSELTIYIYQNTIITQEVKADFEKIAKPKKSFGKRLVDSLNIGWQILEEAIIFFAMLWGLALLTIVLVLGITWIIKFFKKRKKK